MTQIAVSGLKATHGADTIFSDVTFTVGAGQRWGILGRNGTGKSTLFRMLSGRQVPSAGAIAMDPGLSVSLLEQHPDFGVATTVWEAAAAGVQSLLDLGSRLETLAVALGEGQSSDRELHRYAVLLEEFEHAGGYGAESRIDAVLDGLGFDPRAARQRPIEALSGGERGRLALARELIRGADVLLLDEPTNHLDLDTSRWLEQFLADNGRTQLIVSHDRAFLAALVDHVLHFEGGTATPYASGYAAFVAQRAERRLAAERAVEKQRKTISAEEDYIRRNIAGQNTRQAKGRRKRLERLPRLAPPPGEVGTMSLRLEAAERGGDIVVAAESVKLTGGGRVLLRDFTATVRRGDRVAFVGPNGAGKSTLLRAILREHPIDEGELRTGGSIDPAFYRQDLAQLPLEGTPFDLVLSDRPQWERGAVQGHLGRFGFSGDDVRRQVSSFSGGERSRLALALIMLRRANLLIFDEPTNHLDVETVEALEDAIEAYDGTIIVVSHDRELLRGVTNKVWSLRNARITVFDGSFAEWEEVAESSETVEVPTPQKSPAARQESSGERSVRREEERALRRARTELEEAERRVEELEARLTALTSRLAEQAGSATVNAQLLARNAAEMEDVRSALDGALAEWSRCMEIVESHDSSGKATA